MSQIAIGLLTGPVGVGKTTVAERLVGRARRQGLTCGGLLTPAMLNGCGQKVGIWGLDLLSDERRILARTDRDLGGPRVGPYSFDAAALEWALAAVDSAMLRFSAASSDQPADLLANHLLVVDEIGKMELWQGAGLAPLVPRLAAGEAARSLVLVRESLLVELREVLGSIEQTVFRVSEENRGQIVSGIVDWVAGVDAEN